MVVPTGFEPVTSSMSTKRSTPELRNYGLASRTRTCIYSLGESGYVLFNYSEIVYGGGDRDRTRYLLVANQPLSQMSYTPKFGSASEIRTQLTSD